MTFVVVFLLVFLIVGLGEVGRSSIFFYHQGICYIKDADGSGLCGYNFSIRVMHCVVFELLTIVHGC